MRCIVTRRVKWPAAEGTSSSTPLSVILAILGVPDFFLLGSDALQRPGLPLCWHLLRLLQNARLYVAI